MRKPSYQQPRSTSMPRSLSRMLPKLKLPAAPVRAIPAAYPKVGRVGSIAQLRSAPRPNVNAKKK